MGMASTPRAMPVSLLSQERAVPSEWQHQWNCLCVGHQWSFQGQQAAGTRADLSAPEGLHQWSQVLIP